MSAPTRPGVGLADAARRLVAWHLQENPAANLDDLTALTSHLTGRAVDWREATVLLAATLHAELRVSDATKARDANFALSQIAAQVDCARDRGVIAPPHAGKRTEGGPA